MEKIERLIDQVSGAIGRFVSWFILMMMLITALVVVMRYFLNLGSIPLQETIVYLHGGVIMLSIGYTLKVNGHVRVDVVHRTLTPRQRHWVELLGWIFFLMPVSLFLFLTSLPYVAFSWTVFESSGAPGGLPGVFLLKTVIPIMAALLFLQGLSQGSKALRALRQ